MVRFDNTRNTCISYIPARIRFRSVSTVNHISDEQFRNLYLTVCNSTYDSMLMSIWLPALVNEAAKRGINHYELTQNKSMQVLTGNGPPKTPNGDYGFYVDSMTGQGYMLYSYFTSDTHTIKNTWQPIQLPKYTVFSSDVDISYSDSISLDNA